MPGKCSNIQCSMFNSQALRISHSVSPPIFRISLDKYRFLSIFSCLPLLTFYLYCNIGPDNVVKCGKPAKHEIETYHTTIFDDPRHCGHFPAITVFNPGFKRWLLQRIHGRFLQQKERCWQNDLGKPVSTVFLLILTWLEANFYTPTVTFLY